MRHGNELETFCYDNGTTFEQQVNKNSKNSDDKALAKVVNHNLCSFYIESASCNLKNEEDMRVPGQTTFGIPNLNENMYLVVSSLKHNDKQIVSFSIIANNFEKDYEI